MSSYTLTSKKKNWEVLDASKNGSEVTRLFIIGRLWGPRNFLFFNQTKPKLHGVRTYSMLIILQIFSCVTKARAEIITCKITDFDVKMRSPSTLSNTPNIVIFAIRWKPLTRTFEWNLSRSDTTITRASGAFWMSRCFGESMKLWKFLAPDLCIRIQNPFGFLLFNIMPISEKKNRNFWRHVRTLPRTGWRGLTQWTNWKSNSWTLQFMISICIQWMFVKSKITFWLSSAVWFSARATCTILIFRTNRFKGK